MSEAYPGAGIMGDFHVPSLCELSRIPTTSTDLKFQRKNPELAPSSLTTRPRTSHFSYRAVTPEIRRTVGKMTHAPTLRLPLGRPSPRLLVGSGRATSQEKPETRFQYRL